MEMEARSNGPDKKPLSIGPDKKPLLSGRRGPDINPCRGFEGGGIISWADPGMGPEMEMPNPTMPLGTGCNGKQAKEGVLSNAACRSSGTLAKMLAECSSSSSCPSTIVLGVDVFALTDAPEMDLKANPPPMSADRSWALRLLLLAGTRP
jgi:hypothetical protein